MAKEIKPPKINWQKEAEKWRGKYHEKNDELGFALSQVRDKDSVLIPLRARMAMFDHNDFDFIVDKIIDDLDLIIYSTQTSKRAMVDAKKLIKKFNMEQKKKAKK